MTPGEMRSIQDQQSLAAGVSAARHKQCRGTFPVPNAPVDIAIEEIAFRGWAKALRISNGTVEIIATLDVGPRILSYSRIGGTNPFNILEDQAGQYGEQQWKNRGGHRLCLAPEGRPFSYFPDNAPVVWERIGGTGVRLIPPPETVVGFQKQIDLVLQPTTAEVTVINRITRIEETPCLAAAWALTVMRIGGRAIMPQPPFGEHPRDLLPNRQLVIWPYTDISDPRFHFGRRYYTLQQDAIGQPAKIGFPQSSGWAGYLVDRTLFVKRFPWNSRADYPDNGCNFEVFANNRLLELESLGPLVMMESGMTSELIEGWSIYDNLPVVNPDNEQALAELLGDLRIE